MWINIGIYYSLLLYMFNLDGTRGVPTDEKEVKEYEKSLNTPKKESRFHFYISNDRLMWKDASLACKKKGMALACLDTFEKNTQLNLALNKEIRLHSGYYFGVLDYWIGGFREHNNLAKFQWENGNILGSYGWAPDEPSYAPNEYCLEVKVHSRLLGWNDLDCGQLNKYICMYEDLEETKNTGHIDKDTKRPETNEEENKNLEATDITTESQTVKTPFERFPIWGVHPLMRHWRHPESIPVRGSMYDRFG